MIDAQTQAIAQQAAQRAASMEAQLASVQITTPELAQWASDVARGLKDQHDQLEVREKEFTTPARAILSAAADLFGAPRLVLVRVRKNLLDRVTAFQSQQRAAQVQALLEARTTETITAAVALTLPAIAGQHTREQWSARVVDLDLVPREFLVVDQSRLNARARADKREFAIPGCVAECAIIQVQVKIE